MLPTYMFMLTNDLIQNELVLSPEQRSQLSALHEEYIRTALKVVPPTGQSSKKQDEVSAEMARDAETKRSEDFESRTTRILSVEQVARLEQLRLQGRGYWVVLEPSVQKSLGIREDQLAASCRIIDACGVECGQLAQQARAGKMKVEQAITRVDDRTRAAYDEVVALLTENQQRELRKLLGPRPAFDPGKLRFRLVGKPVRD